MASCPQAQEVKVGPVRKDGHVLPAVLHQDDALVEAEDVLVFRGLLLLLLQYPCTD